VPYDIMRREEVPATLLARDGTMLGFECSEVNRLHLEAGAPSRTLHAPLLALQSPIVALFQPWQTYVLMPTVCPPAAISQLL